MATILALDTSTAACSAALLRGRDLAAKEFEERARGHAEALMPMIHRVMGAAGCSFQELDLVAVTVGPGSWTGLRIAIAAARGLALAAGLPVLGITTLAAVAEATHAEARRGRHLLAALETKRADLYAQLFDEMLAPLSAPAAVPPDALAEFAGDGDVLVAGDGARRAAEFLSEAVIAATPPLPDAAVVARMAAAQWRPGTELPPVEPLYLRPPDTTGPSVA